MLSDVLKSALTEELQPIEWDEAAEEAAAAKAALASKAGDAGATAH